MIEENGLVDQPAQIVDCGCPWHGTVVGDVLDYGGAATMAWTQPDSGDCFLVKVPGAPGSQQTESVNPEHQWLDYAMLSGWWDRQIYNKPLTAFGGSKSWIYSAGVGSTWLVDADGLTLTDSDSKLGGSLTLRSTRIDSPPEDPVTVSVTSHTLPEALHHWDVVSIKPDGSEVIIGLWPGHHIAGSINLYVYYDQGAGCRGMANVLATGSGGDTGDFYTAPPVLLKLALTYADGAHAAILSTYQTAAQTLAQTENVSDSQAGPNMYVHWCLTTTVITSGPSNECVLYDFHGLSWVDDDPAAGSCYVSDPGYDYIPQQWNYSETKSTWRAVVGAYYDDLGDLKLVEMVIRHESTSRSDTTYPNTYDYTCQTGTVWSGSACAAYNDCPDFKPLPFDDDRPFYASNTGAVAGRISLEFDGVEVSGIRAAYDSATDAVIRLDATVLSETTTHASTVVADDVVLYEDAAVNAGGNAWPATNLPGHSTATLSIFGSECRVHAIRYSNSAYGLFITGLPGAYFAHAAYLMGVCDTVTGSRQAPVGYVDAPDDTIDKPYLARFVTVQPKTGAVVQSTSPVSYV